MKPTIILWEFAGHLVHMLRRSHKSQLLLTLAWLTGARKVCDAQTNRTKSRLAFPPERSVFTPEQSTCTPERASRNIKSLYLWAALG